MGELINEPQLETIMGLLACLLADQMGGKAENIKIEKKEEMTA